MENVSRPDGCGVSGAALIVDKLSFSQMHFQNHQTPIFKTIDPPHYQHHQPPDIKTPRQFPLNLNISETRNTQTLQTEASLSIHLTLIQSLVSFQHKGIRAR